MKKLFPSATAIATVMSASVFAADLPSVKSAPAAATPLWTGFYAGLNTGYAFGVTDGATNYGWANPYSFKLFDLYVSNNSADSFALASSAPGRGIAQSGFVGGGQIGYNHQLQNKILLGLEADIQGAGIRGTGNANGYGPFLNDKHPANGFVNNNIIQGGVDWIGTARGRLGYLLTPTFQIYGTGGLAYGGAFLNTRTNSAYGGDSLLNSAAAAVSTGFWLKGTDTSYAAKNQLLAGYIAGGGAEWMFMQNWSMKAEALYYNLGTQSVSNYLYSYGNYSNNQGLPTLAASSTTQVRYDGIIGRAGINYHFDLGKINDDGQITFVSTQSLKTENTAEATHSWTGIFAGLNSGYGFGMTQGAANYGWANPDVISSPTDASFAMASSSSGQGIQQGGIIGGGQLGYNYQYGQKFIIGFETDIQGAGIRGTGKANGIGPFADDSSGAFTNNNIIQAGNDWLGTARGRFGYLITPTFQIYGTGGLAYGNAFINTFANSSYFLDGLASSSAWLYYGTTTSYAARSQFLVGYSAGGGGEWMFSKNWSLKAEAIYYNLGTQSVDNLYYQTFANSLIYSGPTTTSVLGGSTTRARYDGVIGRAGINYHFDFGKAAPVIAKF